MKRRHMRRAQQFLDFAKAVHDILLVIGRRHPTVDALRHAMKPKRSVDYWLNTPRKMKCISYRRRRYRGQLITETAITKEGYAIREFLEDHWDMMPELAHYMGNRLPARNAIRPTVPALLLPSSRDYKRIEKALNKQCALMYNS